MKKLSALLLTMAIFAVIFNVASAAPTNEKAQIRNSEVTLFQTDATAIFSPAILPDVIATVTQAAPDVDISQVVQPIAKSNNSIVEKNEAAKFKKDVVHNGNAPNTPNQAAMNQQTTDKVADNMVKVNDTGQRVESNMMTCIEAAVISQVPDVVPLK